MSTKLITQSKKLRKQAASTESNISVEKRFTKLIQAKKLETQDNEEGLKEFQTKASQATIAYNLGLKQFIGKKSVQLGLSRAVIEKLQKMLIDHHENRLHKIRKFKNINKRIDEIDRMIARYDTQCLRLNQAEKCQYESDLKEIKLLTAQKQQAYYDLPSHVQDRLNVGLSREAYKLYQEIQHNESVDEDRDRLDEDESFENPAHLYSFVTEREKTAAK